ncbi:hypothetical protein JNB_05280 [Janibacter sp. HTCC2649]|uniref:hypothetical protein n=1 Tax=Janibacter sp. HTCC2649 TaxID=313589 RepID=UPI000066ED48|nr:hypothetical protein [Janibacter sp. HTCC2649]EAP99558.1 hypothetical protein JNB_05280 [Janibacter sp. HTCC2649]
MSTKVNAALDRRTAIRFGAVGAAATAATAATVATASNAEAAAGQAILAGRANSAGTAGTTLTTASTAIGLTVKNTGAGAGAFFFAQNNNGFAGGTGAANKYGLSAANTGAVGVGAAMAASGGNNTGVLANTNNSDKYALEGVNLSGVGTSDGGGIYAEGGDGVGLLSISNIGVPAVVSIGDVIYVEGHEVVITLNSVVFGVTSADGPEVTYSRTVTLDGSGAATVDFAGPDSDDVDFASAIPLVSANSAPMPNLWITITGTQVKIAGGVAGGTASFRVVASRTDWGGAPTAGARRAPAGVDIAKSSAKVAKERANRK